MSKIKETFKIKMNGNWATVEISRNDSSFKKNGILDNKLWFEETKKMINDLFNTTKWKHIEYNIKTPIKVKYENKRKVQKVNS